MSPSLREALASLTSDRRFAEITASFNGMNLRQRFPNLTREEQVEIVRAARAFVQSRPESQTPTETPQRPSPEPKPEAAADLRASPPAADSEPEPPPQTRTSPETVESVWVAEGEPYPPAAERVEIEEEPDQVGPPNSLLRRALVTGFAVVVASLIVWILGRQIMSSDPEGTVEQPVVEETREASELPLAASAEPAPAVQPAVTDTADPDRPTEPPPNDLQADAAASPVPEPMSAVDVQPPPKIPENLMPTSSESTQPAEIAESDTSESMATSSESPMDAEPTAVSGNGENVSVETVTDPETRLAATAPAPAESTSAGNSPDADADATPERRPGQGTTTTANPILIGQIQARLKMVGYDPGPIDGVLGPRTSNAIRAFQQDRGLRVDGEASELLLGILATYSGLQDATIQPTTQ